MYKKYFLFPHINPIFLKIDKINIYWYGIMYFISFILIKKISYLKNKNNNFWKKEEVNNLLCLCFLGLLLGGKLGCTLIYNTHMFIKNPIILIKIWQGGMSFFGGLIGTILVIFLISFFKKKNFLQITDFIVPMVPIGIGMGRIGNFINSELWGKVTNVSWAIMFPNSNKKDLIYLQKNSQYREIFVQYGKLPRHPTQIYECLLEGIILFLILNIVLKKNLFIGYKSSLFLFFYGIIRFFIEYFRESDIKFFFLKNHIILTIDQLFSIIMIVIGLILFIKKKTSFKK
ncbi:prolipoprotein diacylglyceryl transferase [Enterobacteriaceae endosymbiont of Donacia bicoloricornis]|uniref:prolipoprotein diacylglyceryl transferase n=1 Tax=Enterobacteriaceae endosymbiont of Donacia bicoloricornis TaxID=2675772 RepID=UPI00144A0E7F|nr:prolipoprotein diacylglyceryl transferase [Enterobacteriaceae endosymbiont of Donacia bicoloricornis]QJC37910.1 prolipoprotein diacylglyceryl transferase [Enterobacteriaceae endosymbiont of Donacia bicoloricornis]